MRKRVGIVGECPITMPCKCHADTPEGYRKHIRQSILQWTGICSSRKDIIITVPCDSTDAWIMAAFDPRDGIERIENPWENVLSKKKEYHGIRIPGHKKNNRVYQSLVRGLENNGNRWWIYANRRKYSRILFKKRGN